MSTTINHLFGVVTGYYSQQMPAPLLQKVKPGCDMSLSSGWMIVTVLLRWLSKKLEAKRFVEIMIL
jgi:hypothetical protein